MTTVDGPARLLGQFCGLSQTDWRIAYSNPVSGPIMKSPPIRPIFGGQNRGPINRAAVCSIAFFCPVRVTSYLIGLFIA